MASKDIDEHSLSEKIKQLRLERGALKSAFIVKLREITSLMSTENADVVEKKSVEIDEIFDAIWWKSDQLIEAAGTDKTEVSKVEHYLGDIQDRYKAMKDELNGWLQKRPSPHDGIEPGDSVSGLSSGNLSVKIAAKKAALLARAEVLKKQQAIKRQQIELEQLAEKLALESEIQAAEAEERVYEKHETQGEIAQVGQIKSTEETDGGVQQGQTKLGTLGSPSTSGAWAGSVPDADNFSMHVQGRANTRPIMERYCSPDKKREHFDDSREAVNTERSSINTDMKVLSLQQQMLDAVQLPKTELVPFDGNPLKYWAFKRSFETNVGQTTVSPGAKLNRLLYYCTGKALDVIECCTVMDPEVGYLEAMNLLKSRFGNPHVVTNAWINKITECPSLRPGDIGGLRKYADDLRSCILTLDAMGQLNEIDNQVRMVKVVSRLPIYLQGSWRKRAVEKLRESGMYPKIIELADFVQMAAEEVNDPIFGGVLGTKQDNSQSLSRNWKKGASFSARTNAAAGALQLPSDNSVQKYPPCVMCGQQHALFMCQEFKNMKPERRLEFVREKKLCFNCFSTSHLSRHCRTESKCNVQGCARKHSRLIHLNVRPVSHQTVPSESPRVVSDDQTVNKSQIEAKSSACEVSKRENVHVALPVLPVLVQAIRGGSAISTYALLDSGSTNTFCATDLQRKLGLFGSPATLTLTTLERVESKCETKMTSLLVSEVDNRITIKLPHVFTTDNLLNRGETIFDEDVTKWPHLKGMSFPNVSNVQVGLLIGQDVPEALTPVDVRKGFIGEPYAVKTALGWTLNGPMGKTRNIGNVMSSFIRTDQRLDDQIEKFWKLETSECLADNTLQMSRDDRKVLKTWDESVDKVDGHYMLDIPFKCRPPNLPNNYSLAESRLESLNKRLSKGSDLLHKYQAGIKELLDKGFAEEVPVSEVNKTDQGVWYLPHHGVTNIHKPDKFRIVFDCAAQFCGVSLNDEVYQGPDMTNKLVGVLHRFREGPIGVMGDIEAMYHQVKVPPHDRDFLRFLWWADEERRKLTVYRMTVHLFGGVWSPSCASYALRRSAEDNSDKYDQEVINTVLENFYVDDCLKALSSEHEAIKHIEDLSSLLAEGGFKLHKWISNNRNVLMSVPGNKRAKCVKNLDLENKLPTERALGVLWDTNVDEFGFKIVVKDKPKTKRGVMSVISSVYDPLGFVSPTILQAKKIFQDECKLRKPWDEPICPRNLAKWDKWIQQLHLLEQFRLSRCIVPPEFGKVIQCQLHHFSDASEEGYGAGSYARLVDDKNQVHCTLLMSRSRLVPIKPMTIPRLELSAAVVAVRLDLLLKRELKTPISESVFWTDSTIVLQYIRNKAKRFQTFVSNRLAIIHDGSTVQQWRHVKSEDNPADDVSRGLDADKIIASERWKRGPKFLSENEKKWPKVNAIVGEIPPDDKELRRETVVYASEVNSNDSSIIRLIGKYSSWYQVKRAVAWLLRLKAILHAKIRGEHFENCKTSLSVRELLEAEVAIVQVIQKHNYQKEITCLTHNRRINVSSSIFKLEPRLNVKGVLCVGGRLEKAPIPNESKHQMILPSDSHATSLIIRDYHEKNGHVGSEHTLSLIRQKFWIVKGRRTVTKILRRCVSCNRRQASTCHQKMSDLPEDRVTPGEVPFSNVGIDCFGPFLVKRGRSQIKRYGCLFTCLVTRAVHVEKLDSMDADSFLNAFIRFTSRRGRPKMVRSDNGSNLCAGEAELRRAIQDWNQSQINNFMLQKEIRWVFNPPAASHMGGVWERQIRTIRKVLNAITTTHLMDDEGLNTVFCEAESIVNSRPITCVSENPKDLNPLTPNHLLLMGPGPKIPASECSKADTYRCRWKHVQATADSFWKRWLREYLPSLQQRQKWHKPKRNVKLNDVVLIVNENTPRREWPLGRVVATYPGTDGLVRSVDVSTKWSTLRRPIHKLCLLEGVLDN